MSPHPVALSNTITFVFAQKKEEEEVVDSGEKKHLLFMSVNFTAAGIFRDVQVNKKKKSRYEGFFLEIKICFYVIAVIISRHGSNIQRYSAGRPKTGRLIFN